MITEHLTAVESLLAPLQMTLYVDGQVPEKPDFPYAVLFVAARTEEQTRLCGDTDSLMFRFQVTSVGLTNQSAVIVSDAVRSLLVDVRPEVTGRVTGRIKPGASLPVTMDDSVIDPSTGLHPAMSRDTYGFYSRPS